MSWRLTAGERVAILDRRCGRFVELARECGFFAGIGYAEAVVDGSLLRVRPIMMTVAATVAGLLTVMLGGGTGSEVMRRIAAPMVGGMISATILTLVVIPALFLLWRERLIRDA